MFKRTDYAQVNRGTPVDRFWATMELYEFGEMLVREKLRRQFPEASEQEIEDKLGEWLRDKPLLSDQAPEFFRISHRFDESPISDTSRDRHDP